MNKTLTKARQDATESRPGPFDLRLFLSKYGLVIVFVAVFLGFAAASGQTFLNPTTWMRTILSPSGFTPLLILSVGLTVVLAMRDFDLSFAAMVGLAGSTAVALMVNHGQSVVVAILATFAVAITVGVVNGFLIAYLGASSFVITLAIGTLLVGVETLWTNNRSITGVGSDFYLALDRTVVISQLRLPFFIAIGLFLAVWLLLERTELGRYMYAIGGNPEAARLTGIPVARIRLLGFVIVAVSAAVVGILLSSGFGGTRSDLGTGFLLGAYAAVFLGAAVFKPGQFNVPGTLLGVVFLRVIEVGLLQLQIQTSWINIAKGAILVFGVLLSQLLVRKR
jgi:ribose transport system permease protein